MQVDDQFIAEVLGQLFVSDLEIPRHVDLARLSVSIAPSACRCHFVSPFTTSTVVSLCPSFSQVVSVRTLSGRLIGLKDDTATLAMMRTRDGQGIELDTFHTPNAVRFEPMDAPVNTLGVRRIMFAVDDIDAVVARMRSHGAELIGDMQY